MLDQIEATPTTLLDALIREHNGKQLPVPKALNRVLTIVRAASRHSGYSVADLISHRHRAPLARMRHIVMYLSYHTTSMSMPEIARQLGDRDHTTILHGIRKMERLVQFDDRLSDDIEAVRDLAIAADPELGARG